MTATSRSGSSPHRGEVYRLERLGTRDIGDENNDSWTLFRALPDALDRKYPNADRSWGWQFVFPASSHYRDRHTGIQHRYHLHESVVQKAMSAAVLRSGVVKPATQHLTRYVILSPQNCYLPDMTSAPCKNYWATKM